MFYRPARPAWAVRGRVGSQPVPGARVALLRNYLITETELGFAASAVRLLAAVLHNAAPIRARDRAASS